MNREGPGRAILCRSSPTRRRRRTQTPRVAPNHPHSSFLAQTANKQGQWHYTINGGPAGPAIQAIRRRQGTASLTYIPSSPLMRSKGDSFQPPTAPLQQLLCSLSSKPLRWHGVGWKCTTQFTDIAARLRRWTRDGRH